MDPVSAAVAVALGLPPSAAPWLNVGAVALGFGLPMLAGMWCRGFAVGLLVILAGAFLLMLPLTDAYLLWRSSVAAGDGP
jgi:uncharacterized membrane protein YphA (DoxX/SURF4 family)